MKGSTDRILTTHAGSLPRPVDLLEMVAARAGGRPVDTAAYAVRLREAVGDIVQQQVGLGVDVIDDGEMSKPGFIHYVNERLAGFEPSRDAPAGISWARSREVQSFPEFYDWFGRVLPSPGATAAHLACTGPIGYKGHALLQADLGNLRAALDSASPAEVFVPAISPSNVEHWHRNAYYKTQEEYLFAIAEAMREEYRAIVDAGFLLQIDDPRLVTYWILEPSLSLAECRAWCRARVEALNHALRDIPEDRVRFHTCYGINMGPRVHDMELKDVVDIILSIRAGAYSFEAANPRHEHEWRVWKDAKLPDGKLADSRRHHAVQHAGRASRAGRRPHRAVRRRGGTRARHRRQRLRLRDLRGLDGDPSEHRVGQACRPRRGRASRVPPPLGAGLRLEIGQVAGRLSRAPARRGSSRGDRGRRGLRTRGPRPRGRRGP